MWERHIDRLPLHRDTNPQPWYVAWLGIEPVTLQFIGWCSSPLGHTSQGPRTVWTTACFSTIWMRRVLFNQLPDDRHWGCSIFCHHISIFASVSPGRWASSEGIDFILFIVIALKPCIGLQPQYFYLLRKWMNIDSTRPGDTDPGSDSLWMGFPTLGKSHHLPRLQVPYRYE